MRESFPSFYGDFRCTASKCKDSCCIGWEIDIDRNTFEKYMAVQGDMGEKLKKNISDSQPPYFRLTEGERCPFLKEDGLCEIICRLGEEYLCDICREHPRFHEWYCGTMLSGISMCCEEGARLIFKNGMDIEIKGEDESLGQWETEFENAMLYLVSAARGEGDIFEKCSLIIRLAESFQRAADNGEMWDFSPIGGEFAKKKSRDELLKKVISFYIGLEKNSEIFGDILSEILMKREKISKASEEILKNQSSQRRYGETLAYFIYRYFLKGLEDGEVISKTGFACLSVLVIHLMDCLSLAKGVLTDDKIIENAVLYSKEAEYSEDNLELLYDFIWEEDMGTAGLLTFFRAK